MARRTSVLNGTTLLVGLAVQACESFVKEIPHADDPTVRWHFLNPSRLLSNLASWAVFSESGAYILFVLQGHGMTGKTGCVRQ